MEEIGAPSGRGSTADEKSTGAALRNAVIEECAKVAEACFADVGWHAYFRTAAGTIADNIRALASSPVDAAGKQGRSEAEHATKSNPES